MKRTSFASAAMLGVLLGASVMPIWAAECIVEPSSKALANNTLVSVASAKSSLATNSLLNFDRYRAETSSARFAVPGGFEGRHQSVIYDRRMGLPTFLWAQKTAAAEAVGALPEREQLIARARAHLRAEAVNLKLTDAMIDEAVVSDAQYNGNGPAVVRFKQQANGKEVFGRTLNVLLDRNGKPIAVSGYFATSEIQTEQAFARSPAQAIAAAWSGGLSLLGGVIDATQLVRAKAQGQWEWYSGVLNVGNYVFERLPRVKAGYYAYKGKLEPAYYVELFALGRSDRELKAHALVVSASDGSILQRRNLVASATPFTYRVFADDGSNHFQPYDSPLGNGYTPFPGASPSTRLERISDVTTQLVTLSDFGIGDPWLPDGATETIGNNTNACIDAVDSPTSGIISSPILDPILNTCVAAVGDIYPATTSANTFDYALDPDEDPSHENAQNAAAVSLFYINNWLHDLWYKHGFNEAAGNAQTDNFGRGGEEGDVLLAQGQDASGRSNANMATPADGSSPRMQQYLFDGVIKGAVQQVAPITGESLLFSVGTFSPASFDVPATSVVLADDDFDVPTDGCGPALPDPTGLLPTVPATPQLSLAGAIALVDRGSCSFTTKARFAQLSGAAGIIIVNNIEGDPIPMGNADIPINIPLPVGTDATYTIPSVMIKKSDGQFIKDQIAAGTDVQMILQREESTDLDGTLDNQIVAHEFFHYVHHRLTDSSSTQSGGMSEGWGDIDAFLLSARAEDRLVPGNDKYQGAYGLAGYVVNSFYSGIRRAPYSTSFDTNAFTFKHISDGEPTPDGGAGATNSEVHNSGEIWANQVWECYVGLLNDPRHTFDEARDLMRDYVIGGLKMTPADATFVEARDAILSVVLANDFKDYAACSAGFAKRGSGLNAIAPDRDSTDLVGVVEDYTPFVCKSDTPDEPDPDPVDPDPVDPNPTPVDPVPTDPTVDGGRFGGGALNLLLLLPLLGMGFYRRRRRQ